MILITDDETKIIPGHGDLSTKADLKKYLIMLTKIKNRVLVEIEKEKTVEEVKANTTITKGYESYSWWITEEKIRETIFKSLTEN